MLNSIDKYMFENYENFICDTKIKTSPNYPKINLTLSRIKICNDDVFNILKISSAVQFIEMIEELNDHLNLMSKNKNELMKTFKLTEQQYKKFIDSKSKKGILWIGVMRNERWIECIIEVKQQNKTFRNFSCYSGFSKTTLERKKIDRKKVWQKRFKLNENGECFSCDKILKYKGDINWECSHKISVSNGVSYEITN